MTVRKIIFIFFFSVAQVTLNICANTSVAQNVEPLPAAFSSSQRSLYLSLGLGMGRDLYRDQGTSPLSYPGIAAFPDMGFIWERPCYRWQIESLSGIGMHTDAVASRFAMDAIGVSNRLEGFVLRKWQPTLWRGMLLYGVGIGNQLYVRYNLHHQNASVGVSNFTYINLHVGVEWPLGGKRKQSASWCLLAEADLQPLAGVLRPGYAFIDNYTGANNLYATFGKQYQYYAKAFSGIATELGVRKEWSSGHRMTLSYQWQYFNSGLGSGWRYENATHSLCCRFDLLLRKRPSAQ